MKQQAVRETDLPGLIRRGKVRDIYDLGERLMVVASDRISAFDVIMKEPVPGKGKLLTAMSKFWLEKLPACSPHHLDFVVDGTHVPRGYESHVPHLDGRAMVVKKATVLPIECVVRGYLAGGGWKEYLATGRVSGVKMPPGLRQAEKLAEPIFTPSTKAESGHDEPIDFDAAIANLSAFLPGAPLTSENRARLLIRMTYLSHADNRTIYNVAARILMEEARERSLEIYLQAAAHAAGRGIILADTKFEFGLCNGVLTLVDEVLTPDSSRFWPAESWRVGENPPSFDKQYLRDYLNSLGWNKQPPPPEIPQEVIDKTRDRYEQAWRALTT